MFEIHFSEWFVQDEEDQSGNLILPPYRKPSQNMQSEHDLSRTVSRNLSTSVSVSSYSDWRIVLNDAVAVSSDKGETLQLKKEVIQKTDGRLQN